MIEVFVIDRHGGSLGVCANVRGNLTTNSRYSIPHYERQRTLYCVLCLSIYSANFESVNAMQVI